MTSVLTTELPAGQSVDLPSNNLLKVTARTASMPAGSSGVVQCIRFALGLGPVVDSATDIPATAVVLATSVDVRNAYDPGTTIMVGKVGALDLLQTDVDNFPPIAQLFPKVLDVDWATSAKVRATVGGAPTVGDGWVIVQFSVPDP